jgi:PAS domain S-box-containing protein
MHRLQITYEQLLETIQEGIWVIDADSNTTFVNPKMAEILGYDVEEMIGKNLFAFLDEEEIQNAQKKVDDRKSGLAETHGSKIKHKDGHDVYIELKTTPVTDNEGNYKGAIAGVTDITERKKAEEALRVSEKKLSDILNNMTDTVWSITWPDFRHIYHSPSLEKLYGRSAQEFYDNPTLFKEITHPEDQHLTEKAIEQLLKEGQATRECRVVKTDGSIIWINDRSKLIYDENHQPVRVDGVTQNITDRKQVEEALKLQASERAAVDAFTNSVSYDLQAPLRRIEGFSEALLEECPGELSELARDYLQRITRQIGSMKERTDALLKLSRIVSHDITCEEVNLSALARAYLKKLCHAEPERQIETAIAPDLVASGDAHLLSIVLENLLHNAWKFTAGVERARIECGSIQKNGLAVYFVKDNGVGFDQQRADEIFDPFKKLHSETEYPGIGIGLNLVYRIITRHGGEIWAEGEEGNGACFFFTLP